MSPSRLVQALRVFVRKYDAAPDGPLGCGLVNGDFLSAKLLLEEADASGLAQRPIHLHLTELGAEALMRLAQKERRRCERQLEKNREAGWKPEPGHGDMNRIRLGNLQDLITQLKGQLP